MIIGRYTRITMHSIMIILNYIIHKIYKPYIIYINTYKKCINTCKHFISHLPHIHSDTACNISDENIYCCINTLQNTCQNCTSMICFDSEGQPIGIDTMSTYCMTNDMSDFTGTPTPVHKHIRGISDNSAEVTYKGTAKCGILKQSLFE